MHGGHPNLSARRMAAGATSKRRSHASLFVLVALFGASTAGVVLVFDVWLSLDESITIEAQSADDVAVRQLATARRPRARVAERTADDAVGVAVAQTAVAREWTVAAGAARPSSRHAGGRPDATTPQGRKLFDDLLAAARSDADAKRRAGAVRSLAGMFGQGASDALAGIADDPTQPEEVREVAANSGRRDVEGSK